MATEILRPIGISPRVYGANVSQDSNPKTKMEEMHKLINEEISDEDSTYIIIGSGIGLPAYFDINMNEFESLNIQQIKVNAMIKNNSLDLGGCNINCHLWYTSIPSENNSGNIEFLTGGTIKNTLTLIADLEWNEYIFSFTKENLNELLNQYKALTLDNSKFYFLSSLLDFNPASGSSSKSNYKLYLTQLYIEVEYKDESGTTQSFIFYLKENNEWIQLIPIVF